MFKDIGKLKLLIKSNTFNGSDKKGQQQQENNIDIPAQLYTILDNTKWDLSDGKLITISFLQLAPFIVYNSCILMNLNRNNKENIIKIIQNIKFTQLKQLSLNGNKIESIENLSLVFMPNLQNLMLNQNQITSLRPLWHIASNCQQIQWLSVQDNPILQMHYIPSSFVNLLQSFKYLQVGMQQISMKMNWTAKVGQNLTIITNCDTIEPFSKILNRT